MAGGRRGDEDGDGDGDGGEDHLTLGRPASLGKPGRNSGIKWYHRPD